MKHNCKDCVERKVNCHSSCVSYLAFRKHKDLENKKKLQTAYYNEQREHYRNKRINKYGHGPVSYGGYEKW